MGIYRNLFNLWYHPIISPVVVRTLNPITPEEREEFSDGLTRLVQNFGNESWVLSGGVAVQLNSGALYRKVPNFNLSLPVENLYEMAKLAEQRDYLLLSRGWQLRYKENVKFKDKKRELAWEEEIEVRHETYEKVEFVGEKLKRPYSNMRFVKMKRKEKYFQNPDILDFIDVHPSIIHAYKPESSPQFNTETLISLDRNETELLIPKKFADKNITYSIREGAEIQVRGPEYMDYVLRWFIIMHGKKSKHRRMISWYDLGKLYNSIGKDFGAFCENYVSSEKVDLRKLPVITGIKLDEMARLWGKEKEEFHEILGEYVIKQKNMMRKNG